MLPRCMFSTHQHWLNKIRFLYMTSLLSKWPQGLYKHWTARMLWGFASQHSYSSRGSGDPSSWHTCHTRSNDDTLAACYTDTWRRLYCISRAFWLSLTRSIFHNLLQIAVSVAMKVFTQQIYLLFLSFLIDSLLVFLHQPVPFKVWCLKVTCTWLAAFRFSICNLGAHNPAQTTWYMNVSRPSSPTETQTQVPRWSLEPLQVFSLWTLGNMLSTRKATILASWPNTLVAAWSSQLSHV